MQALPIFTKRLFHPSLITQSLPQSYPLDHGKKKNSRRGKKNITKNHVLYQQFTVAHK